MEKIVQNYGKEVLKNRVPEWSEILDIDSSLKINRKIVLTNFDKIIISGVDHNFEPAKIGRFRKNWEF